MLLLCGRFTQVRSPDSRKRVLARLASVGGCLGAIHPFGRTRPSTVRLTRTAKLFSRVGATNPVPEIRFALPAYLSGMRALNARHLKKDRRIVCEGGIEGLHGQIGLPKGHVGTAQHVHQILVRC